MSEDQSPEDAGQEAFDAMGGQEQATPSPGEGAMAPLPSQGQAIAPPAPIEPADDWDDELGPPQSKWPKVIGIISLIYAILGMLCQVVTGIGSMLTEFFMGLGGFEVDMPPALKVIAATSAVLLFITGVILLMGAINLLRRRPSGVSLHKTWAVLRLLLVVIGVAAAVTLTMPMQMQFQEQMNEAVNARLREAGQPERPFVEKAETKKAIIMTGVMAGLQSIWPLFVGFYLSRGKITAEVEQWI